MPTTEPGRQDPTVAHEGTAGEAGRQIGPDLQLRGDVQSQIFRSKLLMSRARELLDALMALGRQSRN